MKKVKNTISYSNREGLDQPAWEVRCHRMRRLIRVCIVFTYQAMRDSSQLTPLSTFCKQPGPIIWIPLILSLISLLRVAAFSLRNLTHKWLYVSKATKISKRNIVKAIKYIMLINLSYVSGKF